ncbi:putative transcription factor C2H2 family [Helianthus anomalus]
MALLLPPPPISFICIISIITLYLMICYAVIGFLVKSRVASDEAERSSSGFSLEELKKLQCFNHRINKDDAESLCCAICLDDFKDFQVCKRFPSCDHLFHSHCIDLWLVHRRTCPICRTTFDHLIHVA